jgi:dipeptide/tripeptide permease
MFLVIFGSRAASAQYNNLLVCSLYAVGLTILLITSLSPLLWQGSGLPGLIVALIVISLGVGGVKSTLPPFLGQSNRYTRLSHKLVTAAKHVDT